MHKILALTAASGLALTGIVVLAPAASAKDGDVKMRSACTGGPSFSVVKVKNRTDGLRTDFYVKNNAVGQAWSFTLTQGSAKNVVASSSRATHAVRDDSASNDDTQHAAEVKFRNYLASGAGPLVFTATSGAETCQVTVNP